MTKATVLVPTHEHDGTIEMSVASALAQTERDLEILIVGDGPTDRVRAAGERLAALDPRVSFLPFPKGKRHGEANRHEALKGATGRIVCYLSDDDLWLPDHMETMLALLFGDFLAHTYPTFISVKGSSSPFNGSPKGMLAGHNYVPLSAMGHTMTAYRALPVGWSPAPPDVYTDLNMWRKFLLAGFRIEASPIPTVVHFPSHHRVGWNQDRRRDEIGRWARVISTEPEAARRALLGGTPIP
jgi:hypothetical protein